MRKGINSLIGVVKERMGADVRNGDVFIFIGSSRRLMKLLHAEDGGMVMYVKRLEAGRFRIPEYDPDTKSYPMEWRVWSSWWRESPRIRHRGCVVCGPSGQNIMSDFQPKNSFKKTVLQLYMSLIFITFVS